MKITVDHSTTYRYQFPVQLEPHTFRLQPRMSANQRLLAYDLQITPEPAGSTESLDQDGNLAHYAWFQDPTTSLHVRSRFTVENLRENPFDFFLVNDSLHLPLWYREPLSTALFSYRLDANVTPAVRQFAQSLANAANGDVLAFLSALTNDIFHSYRPITRVDGAPWTSDYTLRAREGSCRDLAVLFCDACRVMGIAARFVSGYEYASAGQTQSYMHAWAEVYLPSAGWRGYDPSRGLAVTKSHVAVAAAFHSDLASPIAGIYTGGSYSHMEATIRLTANT